MRAIASCFSVIQKMNGFRRQVPEPAWVARVCGVCVDSARAVCFAWFMRALIAWRRGSECREGCILRVGGGFLFESLSRATGFPSDSRE